MGEGNKKVRMTKLWNDVRIETFYLGYLSAWSTAVTIYVYLMLRKYIKLFFVQEITRITRITRKK